MFFCNKSCSKQKYSIFIKKPFSKLQSNYMSYVVTTYDIKLLDSNLFILPLTNLTLIVRRTLFASYRLSLWAVSTATGTQRSSIFELLRRRKKKKAIAKAHRRLLLLVQLHAIYYSISWSSSSFWSRLLNTHGQRKSVGKPRTSLPPPRPLNSISIPLE